MNEIDQDRGLYSKYRVERVDGKDKGPYFVLGYRTDRHARAGLAAYAASCRQEFPALAADLDAELSKYPIPLGESSGTEDRTANGKERHFVGGLDERLDRFLDFLAAEYSFPLTVENKLAVYHFFVDELNDNPSSRYLIAEALTAAAARLTADGSAQ